MTMNDFKVTEIPPYEQSSEEVRTLARRNAQAFAFSVGLSESQIPKPLPTDVLHDALVGVHDSPFLLWLDSNSMADSIILVYALHPQDDTNPAQAMSDTAYFLACNGMRVTATRKLVDTFLERFVGINFPNSLPVHLLKSLVEMMHYSGLIVETTAALPKELLAHLEKCSDTSSLVKEVCRLQMLSPSSMRAESALQSLLNAWNLSAFD